MVFLAPGDAPQMVAGRELNESHRRIGERARAVVFVRALFALCSSTVYWHNRIKTFAAGTSALQMVQMVHAVPDRGGRLRLANNNIAISRCAVLALR